MNDAAIPETNSAPGYNRHMTAVYLLRHPETTWNVAQRYQGRLESPVSSEGRRQSLAVIDGFAAGEIDVVLASPLGRARYLAALLAKATGAPLEVDQRLTEMAQGPWEGMRVDDIRRRYPELYETWYRRPDRVRFPGGEALSEVCSRALSVMSELFRRWPNGNVAVVTHSVVIQTLAASALSLELSAIHRLRVSNCGVTILCGVDAPGQILTFNSLESLYGSAVAGATAQHCPTWKPRRIAS